VVVVKKKHGGEIGVLSSTNPESVKRKTRNAKYHNSEHGGKENQHAYKQKQRESEAGKQSKKQRDQKYNRSEKGIQTKERRRVKKFGKSREYGTQWSS
jgi:hypothetical protein